MENNKKGFFAQLVGSITNMESYQYFFKRTSGKAILYLLLLSLIFGTASYIRTVFDFNLGITKTINYFKSGIPDFTFDNGELNMKGTMPLVLDKTEGDIIIIDTTGKTDESILNSYPNGVLVTNHEFIQKENYGIKKQSFEMMQGVRFTKDNVLGFLPYFRLVNIFIVIFGVLFFFIGKLVSALWLAIVGIIISAIAKYKLPFETQYKLSIYALTLPIILKVLLAILKVTIPYFWIIYYGIAVVYLWKAIIMLKKDVEKEKTIGSVVQ